MDALRLLAGGAGRSAWRAARRAPRAAALVVLALAGCALPGRRQDLPETALGAAPEPIVTPVRAAGLRYYEPATSAPDERLRTELAALLAGVPGVERAYLAVVREGAQGAPVLTVCIAGRFALSDDTVRRIGRVFAGTHGTTGVLDVLELGAAHERVLARSLPPFYGDPLETQEIAP